MSAIKRLQEQYDKQAEKAQETVKEVSCNTLILPNNFFTFKYNLVI